MTVTAPSDVRPTVCALDGCEQPVEQPSGGGRPRLYCSDRHRSEARRRRKDPPATPPTGLEAVASALETALAELRSQPPSTATSITPEEADSRVRATEELLAAQHETARLARDLSVAREELEESRISANLRQQELEESLNGAKAELESVQAELQAVSSDATKQVGGLLASLEELRAHSAAAADGWRGEIAVLRRELDGARDDLAAERARGGEAERRAEKAENALGSANKELKELELRAARAEAASEHENERVQALQAELREARKERAADRKHFELALRSLTRQLELTTKRTQGSKGSGGRRRRDQPVDS